jgi:ABC-type transporter Mla MlaB component
VSIHLHESDATYALRLDGEVGIERAVELKECLMRGLASGLALLVNVEDVTGVDVTTLQLLWAAQREASVAKTGFALDGRIAANVIAALNEAGFENFLMEAK